MSQRLAMVQQRGSPARRALQSTALASCLLAALLSTASKGLAAQQQVRVSSDACSHCQLQLARQAVLGQGNTLLHAMSHVAVDSKSNFIAANTFDSSAPLVLYDPSGRELLTFGRSGRGPGEFHFIEALHVLPGDSILALEGATATVIGPRLAGYSRALHLPITGSTTAVLRSGELLLPRSPTADLPPFLLWSPRTGEPHSARVGPPAMDFFDNVWLFAETGAGRIWAGNPNAYQLREYSREGQHLRTLTRTVGWFRPWRSAEAMRLDGQSSTAILVAVHERSDGTLLTVVRIPQADVEKPKREERGAANTVWKDSFDTIVEAIDPDRGVLLATLRSDLAFAGFVQGSDGLLLAHEELPDGRIIAGVWQVTLTRGGNR